MYNSKKGLKQTSILPVNLLNIKVFLRQTAHLCTGIVAGTHERSKQALTLLTILCLLTVSTPAAPETIYGSVYKFKHNLVLSFKLSNWFSLDFLRSQKIQEQETQEERNSKVVRIEIDSPNSTFILGKEIALSAISYDQNDIPVSGVTFEWTVENPEGENQEVFDGFFTAKRSGDYKVTVRAASREAFTQFNIIEPAAAFKDADTAKTQNQPLVRQYDEWDVENIKEAHTIENVRGNVPGIPKGKNNFNIIAPVMSIPGRGMGLDLNLSYNSQVWSKLGQDISYDMDKEWLAPGWSVGFGKIINMVGGGIVQVDADGTRRFYSGDIKTYSDRIIYKGQSTDGSFIKARTETIQFNNCFQNPTTYLKYPDGTTVKYGLFGNPSACFALNQPITMVPIRISDRNGNQINISYYDPTTGSPGRWISNITDTLGRMYTFNYTLAAGRYLLTGITGPGLPDENGVEIPRTFVKLDYKDHTITHNFTGLTPHVRESTVKMLSAIYYPATRSGYWFGDNTAASPSYSSYGMIRKVEEHKAMNYDAATGAIAAGQMTRQRIYSYPVNNTTAIDDIPEFSTVTESWEGMTDAAPVTTYESQPDATPRTSTIISPDQSKVVETSYNFSILADSDPEKAKDGLTYETKYYGSDGQMKAKDEITWEPGVQVSNSANSQIPRPKTITHSEYENGITLTKSTINDTFGDYNQVLTSHETGYGGAVDIIRKYTTEFIKKGDVTLDVEIQTDTEEWRAKPRLVNLPSSAKVQDKNDISLSYTSYEYDLNPLKAFDGTNPPNPPGFCSDSYCASITERGNLSKTKVYENAQTLAGELSDNLIYDKAGNLVEYIPEVTGTTKNTYKYTSATQYAYPLETVTGPIDPNVTGTSIKSTATYNFNTGLPITVTDPDLQTVTFGRNAQNWRLTRTSLPTGGYSTLDYDDSTRTYSRTAYTAGNVIVGKQLQKINGLGLPYRQESFVKTESVNGQNQNFWNVVEVEYDKFGRAKRTSNPFSSSSDNTHGDYWSEVFYDASGRVWKTTSPDGSTKFTHYNEAARPAGASTDKGKTFRTADPIGREKWYRTDSDGNIAEVIEPDANGTGSVTANGALTKYAYDPLGRLKQTEQGAQLRKFRYDSLGRLTNQKMAETAAALKDDGTVATDGSGVWSDYYKYDKLSNVISSADARGVKTNYSYVKPLTQLSIDPLNRLFSISYDTNGAANVLPSPTVNFEYQPSGNVAQLKQVTTVGVSTVELGYDTNGRANQKTTILQSRPNNPMAVNYVYDSLSRVTDTVYPIQHGTSGTRKTVHYDFDTAGRMNNLKVDNVNYASEVVFNVFDQVTSVKIGPGGANQINETYNYNPQTGLLDNQKVLRGGTPLLDLSYEYQRCACSTGGTGQITKITNNIDRNKDRSYVYDALSRLKKVSGGINQGWSQTYSYDRYGNRLGVSSLGFENLQHENAAQNNTDDRKKILKESFPASAPTSKELLSGVKNLTDITESKKEGETPVSLYKQSENDSSTSESQLQVAKKEKKLTNQSDNINSPNRTSGKSFDFDNDGKADYSGWQPSSGSWTVHKSASNQTVTSQFGAAGDQIAPADYDGDGKTDIAVFRPNGGNWYILRSSDNVFVAVQFGAAGDAIAPGDYDNDGKSDIAVWRPSNEGWYILNSSNGSVSSSQFGGQRFGDIPAVGDYDGDGKTDIAVWRPGNGTWYIVQSSNGQVITPQFGSNGDVPVPNDYDGDGKTDLAVWRPGNGTWYIIGSLNGAFSSVQFGSESSRDVLVPADYDGDGKTDLAVWRPATGSWYVVQSSNSATTTNQLGASGHIPIPSAYIRRSSAPKKQSSEMPRDGLANLTYDASSNRITTSNFEYDAAGNQTRKVLENGAILRFQYDAAGKLVKVKNDNGQTIVTYTYGASRERLITQEGDENSTNRTYYAWEAGAVISEYVDSAGSTLVWTKNYIFMGGALLATQEQTGNGERVQFDHPDQLGTRVITDAGAGTSFEQNTMPFGTALDSESTGAINRRFTNYDRSASTGLDYATNRFYDSSQGRFTQIDPIAMGATRLTNPQTLNLYAYCNNDPVNHTDPDGLDGDPQFTVHHGGWWGWGTFDGRGGGTSINAAWSRFFQGLFGSLFGGTSYAGRSVPVLFNMPSTFISAMDRYGLPNAGETKAVDPPPQDNPCTLMADKLQDFTNERIRLIGGVNKITSHEKIDSLLKSVNSDFSIFYTGKAVLNSKGATTQRPPFGGAGGFKGIFRDKKENEDQTHHFAGYFNTGILGRYWAATAHKLVTDTFGEDDNPGDRALGDLAYSMGASLNLQRVKGVNRHHFPIKRDEPVADRLKRVLGIADRVRNEICGN